MFLFVGFQRRYLDLSHQRQHPQQYGSRTGLSWILAFGSFRFVPCPFNSSNPSSRSVLTRLPPLRPIRFSPALQDTPANFQSLVTALHSAGMALMVDIVVNDVAWNLPLNTSVWDPTLGRSSPTATNGVYGVLNQPGDYHPRCVMDYSNVTSVQNCECLLFERGTRRVGIATSRPLFSLPSLTFNRFTLFRDCFPRSFSGWLSDPGTVVLADINTTSTRVRTLLYNLVSSLVTKYGIDGFRIDAAKHVEFSFWKGYAAAAGVFTMGEVLDGGELRVSVLH